MCMQVFLNPAHSATFCFTIKQNVVYMMGNMRIPGTLRVLAIAAITSVVVFVGHAEVALQVLYRLPNTAPHPWGLFTKLLEDANGDFYGTSFVGGSNNCGTVFRITKNGVLTTVFSFGSTNGVNPFGGLTYDNDGNLYGVSAHGGDRFEYNFDGDGTIFKITTNGVFTPLVLFNGTNGSNPFGKLLFGNDGNFYGTTQDGGSNGVGIRVGTIFKVTTNGDLTTLHTFTGADGSNPYGGLTRGMDSCLYGTTYMGGSGDNGTIFRITTNGDLTTRAFFNGTNGQLPNGDLTLGNDGNFYGSTAKGGSNYTGFYTGNGTVFKLMTNGVLTTLFYFNGTNGSNPSGPVIFGSDGNLYGTCGSGGLNNLGTLFGITTNGMLTTLIHIDGVNGLRPMANMVLGRDNNLYGAMADLFYNHLTNGDNIFRLVQRPMLTSVVPTNGSVTLSWNSFTNGVYQVEYKSPLTATNWTVLASNIIATNNSASFTDTLGGTNERYYRVVLSQ